MSDLLLPALDGRNPASFFAALGVLNALADRTPHSGDDPRLSWKQVGSYRPVLHGVASREALLELLDEDRKSFLTEPALQLKYEREEGSGEEHDLKARPDQFIAYLDSLVTAGSLRSLDFAAAFATDVATDNNGNTKPTALHFAAGQQQFLAMVETLGKGVGAADFEEALFGPWRYASPLPVLSWDNSSTRDYALRGSDPSKEKLGVPGLDWLAFRGLSFMRVAPNRDCEVITTGCRGFWKTGAFRWPLWTAPLRRAVVRSLLTSIDVFDVDPRAMEARGVAAVLEAAIRRTDQGGYGSFSPAHVAERKDPRRRERESGTG